MNTKEREKIIMRDTMKKRAKKLGMMKRRTRDERRDERNKNRTIRTQTNKMRLKNRFSSLYSLLIGNKLIILLILLFHGRFFRFRSSGYWNLNICLLGLE